MRLQITAFAYSQRDIWGTAQLRFGDQKEDLIMDARSDRKPVQDFKHICRDMRKARVSAYEHRKLQTSKVPLKSQAQGTSLFTSAASSQRGCPKGSQKEVRVRLPEGQRGQSSC